MNKPLFFLIIIVFVLFVLFDDFAPTGKHRLSKLVAKIQPTLLQGQGVTP